jgi:hypothetical protein
MFKKKNEKKNISSACNISAKINKQINKYTKSTKIFFAGGGFQLFAGLLKRNPRKKREIAPNNENKSSVYSGKIKCLNTCL